MGFFSKLLKGVGSVFSAPVKLVKGALSVPKSLISSVGGAAKNIGSSLTGALKNLMPLAAAAAPMALGMPPIPGLAGLFGGGFGAPDMSKMMTQQIPAIASQLKGGFPPGLQSLVPQVFPGVNLPI